ncbi:MAG: hypothetical protein J0H34_02430 [Rhizobiales bacterium]|nr:hypothetical protein [Hyphomicrobiales bacterium]
MAEIADYIALESPKAALRMIERFERSIRLLENSHIWVRRS